MKALFVLWWVCLGIKVGFAGYTSDVQSEKEISLLELQLQSRINQVIRIVFEDLNFYASVTVKLDERKSAVEKNLENNELDYLPLVIKDQVDSDKNFLKIDGYDIRIVSATNYSSEIKNQIKQLIEGEFKGKKYNVSFIYVGANGLVSKIRSVFRSVLVDNLGNWLMFILTAGLGFFGYQLYKRRTWLTQTHLNVLAHSNVDELVKFIRSEISKNKNILKVLVKEERSDLLGLKTLMPYLQIQFVPEDIFMKSTLIRMEQEKGFYTALEFDNWLKGFSERISAKLIKEGNGPMTKKLDETVLAGLKNVHTDILVKTLKEINDVSTYAVVFHYLDEVMIKKLSSKFDRPFWAELSPKDLYELNHEHIIKNVINRSKKFVGIDVVKVTDEKTRSTDEMIAQVFATYGKNVTLNETSPDTLDQSLNMFAEKLETDTSEAQVINFCKPDWTKEGITKLPANYLTRKFEFKTAEEIASLLVSLPKSTRYFIISHIPQDKVNTIMMILESITEDGKSQEALDCFLKEIASDYHEGLFQLNEKKAA
ncbi:MAG: hypothetical protein A2381_08670 [Bdellovibrionales bacterium RIFOXYB1_FULL_37_110]|nr:MAG: hypothetical protein A2181_08865 [Bdellovibrionales bacterium RIFOXYA1_FULL_38_20]OFZ51229.1 MAG: hypothetical protein A2417_17490 [Bdellovibrionales bacterium RIFOXYC1_FULL_37_79]OFZ60915.1 MAG: hypothetical protein A2381_08670 [Bdellovibrionales bacterium RIFOXYB1_FULL_37_110]OFZ63659.1 MAG: hypothetical protein A2577_07790 [Bdellovibrionales bacterium RIFOXYD1_FULL_36_51]